MRYTRAPARGELPQPGLADRTTSSYRDKEGTSGKRLSDSSSFARSAVHVVRLIQGVVRIVDNLIQMLYILEYIHASLRSWATGRSSLRVTRRSGCWA